MSHKKAPGRPRSADGKKKEVKVNVYVNHDEYARDIHEMGKTSIENLSHMYKHYRNFYFAMQKAASK